MNLSQKIRWILLLASFISVPAFAQQTYASPDGTFAIDLPNSYAFSSNTSNIVYQFSGKGGVLMLIVLGSDQNVAQDFKQGVDDVRGSMPNAHLQGAVKEMHINGHIARWGKYKGTVKHNNQNVPLNAFVGDVMLNQHALVFVTFMGDSAESKWEQPLREAFYSLRNSGEPVTGVKGMKVIKH